MGKIEILDGFKPEPTTDNNEGKKGGKIKNLFKKKPFLIALGVVVVIGLFSLYRKTKTAQETEESSLLIASGYGGGYADNTYSANDNYSDMSSAFNQLQDGYNEALLQLQDNYNERIEEVVAVYDTQNDNLSSQVETLKERYNQSETIIDIQSQAIEMQQDIASMMYNSDQALLTNDKDTLNALHNANKQIAEKYGFTFGDDGYWYNGSQRVYTTALQTSSSGNSSPSVKVASGKTSSSSSSSGSTKKSNSSSKSSSKAISSGASAVVNSANLLKR